MKYINVISKKTGKPITILEAEYDSKLFKKEEKVPVATKEEKRVRKTKAKTITSASFDAK